jgi:hypothetical protein
MNVISISRVHKPVIGETLPNGAMLLDYELTRSDITSDGEIRYGKCLALMPSSPDKYVTWTMVLPTEGGVLTVSGHYFDQLRHALDDFENRRY